jgi:sporulation protein YlmC with PRC-barrel domain
MTDKKNENEIQNDNRHLYSLKELKGYKVADENPDVRGWEIIDRDKEKFGVINELVVDPEKKKVRYLDVKPTGELSNAERLLIPIGAAKLNKDDKNVVVDDIDKEKLSSYPLYDGEVINRDYEIDVVERFNRYGGDLSAPGTEGFYSTPLYDEERFYTNRERNQR